MPKTNASACCGIYLIDIDFFKSINDEFGHLCGDEVLKEVGATLMKCVSNRGFVIRNGGEDSLCLSANHTRWITPLMLKLFENFR